MEETEQPAGGPYFVGKRDELIEAKRSFRTLEGRDILVIHHQGAFFAIDCYCYREYSRSCAGLTTDTKRAYFQNCTSHTLYEMLSKQKK